jgi:SEC-C motif-containing protein
MSDVCACNSGESYFKCCAPYIAGMKAAPTAIALMRSRYTAYTLEDEAYLRSTWDERTCPKKPIVHAEKTKWLGLEVKNHLEQGDEATVEFIAKYKVGGRATRMHEISRFVKFDSKWFYVDGIHPENN